jgi:hypothetical protein
MAATKRQPAYETSPKTKKKPSTGDIDPDAVHNRYVVWRLSHVDLGGKWGWSNLLPEHVDGLHQFLVAAEKLNLHQLATGKLMKQIPVKDIVSKAQSRLGEIERDDLSDLWELRLPNKQRAWGVLRGSIFHFLWWDPNHNVCTKHG